MQTNKIAVVVFAVIALTGCSSDHKTSVATSGGTVTTDTSADDKTTTVTTQDSSMKAGVNAVDPATLGVPVYPGATTAEGGGWAVQSKEGAGQMVTLSTNDSYDAVESWYKSKLPAGSEAMNMKSGDSASAVFTVGKDSDKEQRTVQIYGAKDKTTIVLTHKVKTDS